MSPTNKGIIAIVLSIITLFSNEWLKILNLHFGVGIVLSASFLCSVLAIYLGMQARKGNAKIVGLVGLGLGIMVLILVIISLMATGFSS